MIGGRIDPSSCLDTCWVDDMAVWWFRATCFHGLKYLCVFVQEKCLQMGIVTEIAAIIFLVSLTDFFSFISKHGIDLTDMHLHLCGHPLAFFGKQFLNLLPVNIIDIYRHL